MTTLHPDAICAKCYKEFELPENWFNDIYQRQKELQDFICKKRKGLGIPDELVSKEHIYESLYHYTCMMMETLEFDSAKIAIEKDFEYIDVLFFLCNIGIYAGVKQVFLTKTQKTNDIRYKFNCTILSFLDSLPFKKWKTYKEEDYNTDNFALELFNQALNEWIQYGISQGYTIQYIYNLYRSKLEENKNRQLDKSKGYIGV